MLSQVVNNLGQCRHVLFGQFRRNLGVSAVVTQKAASQIDPIQQLFVDKIREYAKKSQASGGKLVEATSDDEKSLQDNLEKLTRQYNAEGQDFTKFPSFSFTDPELEAVGVPFEAKTDAASAETTAVEKEEDSREDKPYWEP